MAEDGRGDRTAANCQPLRRCLHREEGTKKKDKKWEEGETDRGKLTRQKVKKTKKDKRRKLEKAAKNIWEEEETENGKLTRQKVKETEKSRVAEGVEATRRRLRERANSGLKLFNRENGTCFEMVDLLSWSFPIGRYPDFHRHMSITANKLPEWDSPRRCFLEINDSPNPTHCFVVQVDPETANNFCSCCHADYKVLHPPSGGFRIGWFDYPKGFTGPRFPPTMSAMRKFFFKKSRF